MVEPTLTAAELAAAGRAALIAGDTLAARARFREALEIDAAHVGALLGLATAVRPYREKRDYLLRALAVDPADLDLQATLAQVEARLAAGEVLAPTGVQVREPLPGPPEPEPEPEPPAPAADTLFCYNHPARETGLRCTSCGRPVCTECSRRTPVGQICPECARERRPTSYQVGAPQLLVAGVVALLYALVVTLIAGFVVGSAGFFGFIVAFLLGPVAGNGLARLLDMATGRKRGRPLMVTVSVAYSCGALPYIGFIVLIGGFPLALLFFTIVAISSAIAWLR